MNFLGLDGGALRARGCPEGAELQRVPSRGSGERAGESSTEEGPRGSARTGPFPARTEEHATGAGHSPQLLDDPLLFV